MIKIKINLIITLILLCKLTYSYIQLCLPLSTTTCTSCAPYSQFVSGNYYCQCVSGYYLSSDGTNDKCLKCHTSCASCFGSQINNCLTCVYFFTYDSSQSTCSPPQNQTLTTQEQGYHVYGFGKMANWVLTGFSFDTYPCAGTTILGYNGGTAGAIKTIYRTYTNLPYHFQVRVMAGFYFLNYATSDTAQAQIQVTNSGTHSYSVQSRSVQNCNGASVPFVTHNIDDNFTHSVVTSMTVTFKATSTHFFGIRQVYIIFKLCNATNCSTCTGYADNQCLTCVDTNRIATYSWASGICTCTGTYYQQPFSGTCADPCPSVPNKYYGQNGTRTCVKNCPANTFANDDTYECWPDCPVTSVITGQLIFRDYRNWLCVRNCPSTQPYAHQTNRKCYATCPTGSYATDAVLKRCVNPCPNNATYKLFAHIDKCISHCPDGFWADPNAFTCVSNCTAPTPYKDNSTGQNRCIATCPSPSWFGQNSNYYCVQTCNSTQFGEITQFCVNICGSPRWGLLTGNRMCVDVCPDGTWGQPTARTCVLDPTDCGTGMYANNYSRTCVTAANCPFGTFADNSTNACVITCPALSYGHPFTRYCQQYCGPYSGTNYFRDDGNNLCLTACQTQDKYADIGSNYLCVSNCNSTGAYQWRDNSTKTCVNDCNQTINSYVADNTTWTCVYFCPPNYYKDNTTAAPKCVVTCPTNYYADNSTGTGLCVMKCSTYPRKFGDATNGNNLCVDVCTAPLFGDQTGFRLCVSTCPGPYFAQNDTTRLCVKKCNDLTYGWNFRCYNDSHDCPANYFGDDYTNLCVNPCPLSQGTFGDPLSKKCARLCPVNPTPTSPIGPNTYYADISNRQCVLTCNASYSTGLFGNNNTRTCLTRCQDVNSYAEVQTNNRLCVARCLYSPTRYYANNFTQICGPSINCQANYYGQNSTQICVQFCPTGSFAYSTGSDKLCIDICPTPQFGDTSTGKRICVNTCPDVPQLFADPTTRLCVDPCPGTLYGQYSPTRTCVSLCPSGTYSYLPTKRCVTQCPTGYFGDDTPTIRKCWDASNKCTYGFGDPYLNKCVNICSSPTTTPVDLFGSGSDCVAFCPNGTYADSYSASRLCVALCPPGVVGITAPNLYGDPTTHTCQSRCLTINTWADYQTRLCQLVCSSTPTPTYSQNTGYTCVISLNCPTSPSMTFGDNSTRSCLSNCTNGKFGDPNSRNCVTQCPNTTQPFYGDISTQQYICVAACPIVPRLFGKNATNLCVATCPALTYGDQTGKRSCVPQCPQIGAVNHYAQNTSRICVTVCENDTWGLNSSRQCVQDPFDCGSLWAENLTHMCVITCPSSLNLYGDPTTKFCVPVCPTGSYADDFSRTCLTACPDNYGVHGTFANNQTNVCQQYCQQPNAFADNQTVNRYCVTQCSQLPNIAFADPSTKRCVPICPTSPDLYGQTQNFTCISVCPTPYFANTNTRLCVQSCPVGQFRNRDPNICVGVCPANPQRFGDTLTSYCQTTCSGGYFRYTTLRLCVASCQTYSLLQYNATCVQYCPFGYYANSSGNCVDNCPGSTFGENTTTLCQGTCTTGYAYNGQCLAQCPDGLWGQNHICKSACTGGNTASNANNLCVSNCVAGQFMENNVCGPTCSANNYADPLDRLCKNYCTGGRYGDPSTWTCVQTCPVNSYRDASGYCKTDCTPKRKDNITWNCQNQCSTGLWGYNYQCISICPSGSYGYLTDRDCYTNSSPPAASIFGDSLTQTWVAVCPNTPLTFGDRNTKTCVTACTVSTQYADPNSRECQTACTNSSYYRDSLSKFCVLACPTGYFANTVTKDCQSHCTNGFFDYLPERMCVNPCPRPYYGHVNFTCITHCPDGYYSHDATNNCRTGCPTPYFADWVQNKCVLECVNSFATTSNNSCVTDCSGSSQIADNSTNTCVSLCPSQPDYYKQNSVCVANCSSGTFADPTINLRQCVTTCTEGLYGDPVSGRCLTMCLPGYWAQNTTNLCVLTCTTGFADNLTGYCISICPSPSFADSTNKRCMKTCTGNQYGQGRLCVSQCTLPNYSNPLNRLCQTSCPAFDYLFAQNTTHSCVKNCSIASNSYADRNIRVCVSDCTLANQYALDGEAICTSLCPSGLFMENSTKKCVSVCLTGFAEPTSRYCVQRCFGNPQTYAHIPTKTCVYDCQAKLITLYADNSTNICVSLCPASQLFFSDPLSGNCVLFCPQGYYAQNGTSTRQCVTYCVIGFADNLTRKCVTDCPPSQETFADPLTHTCVRICPPNTYAQNISQSCVASNACPLNTWSDDISKYCVSRCPSEPVVYFGLNSTTSCVSQCPIAGDLYGDYVTQTCIANCYSVGGKVRFRDHTSRTCVFECPIDQNLYGDLLSQRCQSICTNNQKRDNTTQMCVPTCPSDPDYFADLNLMTCVRTCPTGFFASDNANRNCISSCAPLLKFADNITNRCQTNCPVGYFSQNITYTCVLHCPSAPDYYADPHTGVCVLNCPSGASWVSFADPVSRSCVTRCPSGYFAVNSTQRCQTQCPSNEYAQDFISVCVAECTVKPHRYKQTNNRVCVTDCPSNAFKYDGNHSCVYTTLGTTDCPGAFYGNQLDFMCTTRCPLDYFAQDQQKLCVQSCPTGQYADPVDRRCKTSCTSDPQYFRYTIDNTCLQFCPSPYYRDNSTYYCVLDCPGTPTTLYKFDPWLQCVQNCPAPYYSYIVNRTCLFGCPNPYFAQDSTRSCQLTCLSPYFADDSTNRCVKLCPQNPNYYGHNNVCRPDCPTNFYRDNSTRMCVASCPTQPFMFADNSTNTCVFNCPATQNFFADNQTRTCVLNCSAGTFADVSTRQCVLDCPQNRLTYADSRTRVCQTFCLSPLYASNLTKDCVAVCPYQPYKTYAWDPNRVCLSQCPVGLFGDNSTWKCVANCPDLSPNPNGFADPTTHVCVTQCPVGYYAKNDTLQCVQNCPSNSWADPTSRICIANCPGNQRLYADNATWRCVTLCPQGSYGDDQVWTCIPSCPQSTPGVDRYILEDANQCVQECPNPYFGFIPTKTCVTDCGAGLYGQLVTRKCTNCRTQCPTCKAYDTCLTCSTGLYLQFGLCVSQCKLDNIVANYANNITMSCVTALNCPTGTNGNNDTHKCDIVCPTKQYKNNTLKSCQHCPLHCSACINSTHCSACQTDSQYSIEDQYCYPHCNSTHFYSYNGACQSSCPQGSYEDYTGVNCQACNAICKTCEMNALRCTSCSQSFLFNNTCVSQCPSNYYSSSQVCEVCTPNVSSCVQPLKFNVSTTTEDFKNVVIITFNKKVNVSGDPTQYIKVKLKLSRLLLEKTKSERTLQTESDLIAQAVNSGFSYLDAIILPDGTIKLILDNQLSLVNPSFEVIFTDPNQIVAADDGATLQMTSADIFLPQGHQIDFYPQGTTDDFSLIIGGTILSITFLIIFFLMFIIGLSPVYFTMEAFQMVSLLAFTPDIAPNIYFFLRQFRITRFTFLPSIFSGLYSQPLEYDLSLPQKVVDTDGQISFAINAGGWIWIPLIYLIFALVVYILTTKIHSNRPLKLIMTKIYETRIKYGILNDILWTFFLNVLFCAFIQFRRTDLPGQTAIAVLSFLTLIIILFALFGYGVHKQRTDNSQQIKDNFFFLTIGTKENQPAYFITFFYHFRRLLFVILLSATMLNGLIQAILCLCVFSIMTILLVIIRPYKDHLHNAAHIGHQIALIFLWASVIHHQVLLGRSQDVGTKILWGLVTTIIIIIYLSIALIWSIYESVVYIKFLIQELKKTQFYMLHLDEQYNQSIQKQLQELKDQQKGQIQSVAITQVGEDDQQVIKLKIKRKKKRVVNSSQQLRQKAKEAIDADFYDKKHMKKQDYVKVDSNNENKYNLSNRKVYQRINVGQNKKIFEDFDKNKNNGYDENNWVLMEQSDTQNINKKSNLNFQQKQKEQNIFEGDFQENISQLIDQKDLIQKKNEQNYVKQNEEIADKYNQRKQQIQKEDEKLIIPKRNSITDNLNNLSQNTKLKKPQRNDNFPFEDLQSDLNEERPLQKQQQIQESYQINNNQNIDQYIQKDQNQQNKQIQPKITNRSNKLQQYTSIRQNGLIDLQESIKDQLINNEYQNKDKKIENFISIEKDNQQQEYQQQQQQQQQDNNLIKQQKQNQNRQEYQQMKQYQQQSQSQQGDQYKRVTIELDDLLSDSNNNQNNNFTLKKQKDNNNVFKIEDLEDLQQQQEKMRQKKRKMHLMIFEDQDFEDEQNNE